MVSILFVFFLDKASNGFKPLALARTTDEYYFASYSI
jgi:hypothetical protein